MSKLLLVEDDKQLSQMYGHKFTKEGLEVTLCTDGSKAIEYAKNGDYDVILLDLMLPGMSGVDVLEMLRSDKRTAKVPVVVYTNFGDKYNHDKCMAYGADEFLLKVDTTPESLTETIKKVLEKNQ